MVKLFVTGATGYIGGDALSTIIEKHPDYEITCLVRTVERGQLLTDKYPNINLVFGDLDDYDVIAEASSKADIVCDWASCEHLGCVKAIVTGLARKTAGEQGFLIHVSGSDILCYPDTEAGTYGILREKVFDDWDGIDELLSVRDSAAHAEVDKAVLEAGKTVAKTAIVCPPTIYGLGRGPGNTRSIQIPMLGEMTLKRGAGLTVEKGRNNWSTVHIHDLSKLFLSLVEAAADGGGNAKWGIEGYYFAENGESSWADIAASIAAESAKKGYIRSTELEKLDAKTADEVWEYATFFWGTNSRCKAVRARKVLGWEPSGPNVFDEISRLVAAEAGAIGL